MDDQAHPTRRSSPAALAPGELAWVCGEALRAILDVDPSGVAVLAGEPLVVQLANRAFRAASESPALDPVGRSVEELWPSDVGLELRATIERVLRSGRPASFEHLEVAGLDGDVRRFAYHARPLPADGERRLLLVLWETTEVERDRAYAERSRERAELVAALAADLNAGAGLDAVLRTALERAAALVGAEDGALWLLAPDGQELVGAAELKPFGRVGERRSLGDRPDLAAAVAERSARLVHVDRASGVERRWMAAHGVAVSLVVPLLREGRTTGVLYLHYGPHGFAPSPHDIAFAESIAVQCALAVGRARVYEAERAARARAEAAEREARRLQELQERMALLLGHDLRTPLQAASLGVAVLAKRGGIAEVDRTTLGRIGGSIARMQRMVDDLLDYARVRAGGGLPVALAQVRLDEVVGAAVAELEVARGRRVDLRVEGDAVLRADEGRVGQLVSNLVGHALRVAPPGAPVSVSVLGRADDVVVAVEAQGVTVDPAAAAHLLEPFAGVLDGALHEHLGLALFIAHEIARAHGGTLEVVPGEREVRLVATLPRRRLAEPATAEPAPGAEGAAWAAGEDEA